jgi:hypothetical protein
MSETGKVLGATSASTTAGIAVLPNTGGNTLLTILSVTLISVGAIVLVSFAATRLYARSLR